MTSVKLTPRRPSSLDETVSALVGAAIDRHTFLWWALLSSISLLNIAVWTYSCITLTDDDDGRHPYRRHHLVLSGIYTAVCAYRSFLPRIDLERYCLWDTAMSSIFLGRTAATIAELSFACQVSLFLRHLGAAHGHTSALWLAAGLVPAIATAQAFCWCGVVTLNHVYHAVEEGIWAVCAALVGAFMCRLAWGHAGGNPSLVALGAVGAVASFSFFAYMVTFDVPMYLRRWREGRQKKTAGDEKKDTATARGSEKDKERPKSIAYMPNFLEGARDAMQRRVVTKRWDVWREESVWLMGYFSSAVWLSLLLIHVPPPS